MFPRDQRLRTTKDIIHVLRRGSRAHSGSVSCSFVRKAATLCRVAVIVDGKVSKKAAVRNLVKRRVRAILHSLSLPPGDLVMRLQKGADTLEFVELQEQINQCLKRIG